MSKGMIQYSQKMFAMCVDDVFDVGIVSIILKYLSTITKSYWFLCAVLLAV